MTWCLLGERWLGVCWVRGDLEFVRCQVDWCLIGERWLPWQNPSLRFPGTVPGNQGGGPQVGPLVDKSPQGKNLVINLVKDLVFSSRQNLVFPGILRFQ